MSDFDLPAALTAFSAITSALKSLSGISKDFKADGKSAEFNSRIIELQGLILDLQGKLSALIFENQELKSVAREANRVADVESSLASIENAYWKKGITGEVEGPFCSMCWDLDRKLVRMIADSHGGGYYDCYHHKLNIQVKTMPTVIDLTR